MSSQHAFYEPAKAIPVSLVHQISSVSSMAQEIPTRHIPQGTALEWGGSPKHVECFWACFAPRIVQIILNCPPLLKLPRNNEVFMIRMNVLRQSYWKKMNPDGTRLAPYLSLACSFVLLERFMLENPWFHLCGTDGTTQPLNQVIREGWAAEGSHSQQPAWNLNWGVEEHRTCICVLWWLQKLSQPQPL